MTPKRVAHHCSHLGVVITGSKDLDTTVSSDGAAELWMSQMALNYVAQVAHNKNSQSLPRNFYGEVFGMIWCFFGWWVSRKFRRNFMKIQVLFFFEINISTTNSKTGAASTSPTKSHESATGKLQWYLQRCRISMLGIVFSAQLWAGLTWNSRNDRWFVV